MSLSGMTVFDDTLHTTNIWLKDLMTRLHFEERDDAYRALRETLHALRDRLPTNTAAGLAAQLPMLIRGFYYEGWRPGTEQNKDRTAEEFTDHIHQSFKRTKTQRDPVEIVQAVFALLESKISKGEIDHVKNCLPQKIRQLWPNESN